MHDVNHTKVVMGTSGNLGATHARNAWADFMNYFLIYEGRMGGIVHEWLVGKVQSMGDYQLVRVLWQNREFFQLVCH